MKDKHKYSKRYAKLLEERGVTQKNVSEKTGIPSNTLSMWKARGGKLSAENLVKLSKFFDVPITYFMDVGEGECDV